MRKYMTVLLALALCLSLAGSAFAEGEAETLIPGEQTETLSVETEPPAPEEKAPTGDIPFLDEEVTASEETPVPLKTADRGGVRSCLPSPPQNLEENHGHEDESENVIYTWDSEFPDYSDGNFISWTWTEMETEKGVKVLHLCLMPIEDPAKIDAVSTTLANEGAVCITHVGKPEVIGQEYKNKGTNHEVYDVIQVKCGACGEEIVRKKLAGEEPHSWPSKPKVGYQNNGSDHTVTYTYTCTKCGATRTELGTETEEHSMEQVSYTGRNYHRGTLHYLEYQCICRGCGHTAEEYRPTPCPGRNDGTGCVFFVTKVDPPVEAQDVTAPEEAAPAEGTA